MKSSFSALSWIFILGSLIGFSACSKSSELGLSLVEQDISTVKITDSLSLNMSTVVANRGLTSGLDNVICGAYIDPVFGEVSASAYLNFSLSSTDATFDNMVFDSIVLSLAYVDYGHYGSVLDNAQTTPQSWSIYRLTETLSETNSYYSDDSLAHSATPVVNAFTFVPNVLDSLLVDSTTVGPFVNIRLDDALGLELMNASNASYYASNTTFKESFNGLAIRPTSTALNDALIRIKSSSSDTRLRLYYHDASNPAEVKTYDFLTNNDAESFSSFKHNYSNTAVLDNNIADTNVYIQGLQGLQTKVDLGSLEVLNGAYINQAELVFTVSSETSAEYPALPNLYLKAKDASGNYIFIEDLYNLILGNPSSINTVFGGNLTDNTITGLKEYRFNITKHFQNMIDGETADSSLYITDSYPLDTERVSLLNNKATANFAKLIVTYTKY